ncbi:MAG TPA: hypothetical protein DCY03_10940 [Planctomycetaceae bacterium]|nr:hypothetical protein [Planctomycetaceae bacterium]
MSTLSYTVLFHSRQFRYQFPDRIGFYNSVSQSIRLGPNMDLETLLQNRTQSGKKVHNRRVLRNSGIPDLTNNIVFRNIT